LEQVTTNIGENKNTKLKHWLNDEVTFNISKFVLCWTSALPTCQIWPSSAGMFVDNCWMLLLDKCKNKHTKFQVCYIWITGVGSAGSHPRAASRTKRHCGTDNTDSAVGGIQKAAPSRRSR